MSDTGIAKPMRQFKPQARKLAQSDVSLFETSSLIYNIVVPTGTDQEELFKPIFWSHVARQIKPMYHIYATTRGGEWFGWYLVIYADDYQVRLKKLLWEPLEPMAEMDLDGDPYAVAWISPPSKWGIRRKSDKEIVKDGFQTKGMAVEWKNQNLSSLGNPNKAA